MKNFLLSFLLLLVAFASSAQSDTTVFVSQNGVFSAINTRITAVGDTATLVNTSAIGTATAVAGYARDIAITSEYRKAVNRLINSAADIQNRVGINPIDSIAGAKSFLDAKWNLRGPKQASINLSFKWRNKGLISWKTDTSSQFRAGVFLGQFVRLNNLNGESIDLYYSDMLRMFVSYDGLWTLRQGVDRNATVKSKDVPAPVVPPSVIAFSDGSLAIGEKIYVYNRTKKQWIPGKQLKNAKPVPLE